MFVTLVSELAYMVSITQFERSVKESNVFFLCGFCGDLGLIDDAFHITVSIHGTLVRFPTIVAFLSLIISACVDLLITALLWLDMIVLMLPMQL